MQRAKHQEVKNGEHCAQTVGDEGIYLAVENLPIAASLQKVQTLTYPKYAATLNFFCSLRLGFLNSQLNKAFFNTLLCVYAALCAKVRGKT
jgi:hypothetical protein